MSETITLKPISYNTPTGSASNPEYAYDNDTTTYANIYRTATTSRPSTTKSYNASAYIYYNMDFSQIPSGVEIIGATLYAKARGDKSVSTNYSTLTTKFQVSAYNRTSSIKDISFSDTEEQKSITLTAGEATAWVNSSSPRVRCYAYCSGRVKTAESSCVRGVHIYVFDIYAIIEYRYPSTNPSIKAKVDGEWVDGTIKAKVNGEWVDATALYIKSNGTWIQIE